MAVLPRFPNPIAHRGLHNRAGGIIENSASAFELAIEHGFAIECDLQLSRDDEPIVFHDATLDRLTEKSGPISGRSAGELRSTPLKGSAAGDCPLNFGALLELVGGRVQLCVELKRQEGRGANNVLAARAAEIARGHEGELLFESFDPDLLIALRQINPALQTGIILQRDASQEDADAPPAIRELWLRHLLHWPQTRFSFISCNKDALELPAVRFFRAQGMNVAAWTVRSLTEATAAATHSDQIVFEGFVP